MQEITSKFTNHLKEALAKSLALVVASKQQTVHPIHLLWALLDQRDSIAAKLLVQAGVQRKNLDEYLAQQTAINELPTTIPNLSEETKIILEKAVVTATAHQHSFISTEHLLAGILQVQPDEITHFFAKTSVDMQTLQLQLKQTLALTVQIPLSPNREQDDAMFESDESLDIERALDYFAKDLTNTEYQKNQTPVIGRDQEIARVCTILGRKTKNNPVLVGDPGVGKSAIVEGLAQRITKNSIDSLKGHKVYALNLASLIAGTMYRGSFEARLQQLIDELRNEPKSILFIDELHTIVGSGSNQGSLDAANILKPALARGEIRCIGATTYEEYKKWIESDGALERRFQKISVEEPSKEETRAILSGVKQSYGKHHGVRYSDAIIDYVLDLAEEHFPDKRFPDKAIDILDEIGSYARNQNKEIKTITQSLVIEALSQATGISTQTIKRQTKQVLGDLDKTLKKNVLSQDKIIDNIVHHLKRAHAGLANTKKPLSSFLFVGPSGVGKTELAKQIAKAFFNGSRPLLRLDMSEYKEAFNASKLLGAPAGYVGYKDTNVLADHVRNYPRSVILFDEIEKAHPDIHNLLLQILEEGSIRDASGRELSFGQSIVILTSNAGRELFEKGSMGFGSEETLKSQNVRSALEDILRPELMNRLDDICVFDKLDDQTLIQIANKKLDELTQRIKEKGLLCEMSREIAGTIVKLSLKKLGARGIDRTITQHIEPIILDAIIASKRIKTCTICCKNDGFVLK
ncbi:MAG: Negative regulator of genetic competence ClpC/MecB [Candidatus Uhrbacteria bacterium GW2011_GWD2_41_121]|uniref:Negative regulator of genetic competence ClpC/MecB n=1 Tax=Candidatus Uhrbacteria bacterium GW2011_GWC1_41_20 TaxID=1618983 RepID=A0A0G0XRT8_9BACT|nr:MAG: Negative regulator of genetic competence ClpC/MecB [Candidatus Uhrbacteria bacterium GW2011_GWE1_39_46]KKR64221.1 MAG: Negative regulator of genetic competence ClpC/MecB [Candidatus Uhrbacteria bacterium GW2011_GWC2_40_450]KKR90354.1 MAG: Negative regulator of genetic competence ClpC/MecB [Candidatus Uhrbacteria bacterium GW2011_GWD2_41_121]KKR96257.1 MAG: Negative regulator of genetic competence ClpC/MecB [Candidatus Uhrbacteria bacterium GW2011_GWD1_41_16]KKR99630.1 MAG: Negative regu